jgi:hypothetical protein
MECNICNTTSTSISCHQQHLTGKKHKRKCMLLQKFNNDINNKDYELMILKKKQKYDAGFESDNNNPKSFIHQAVFCCIACNLIDLSYESMLQHKLSKKHQQHSSEHQQIRIQQYHQEEKQSHLKEETISSESPVTEIYIHYKIFCLTFAICRFLQLSSKNNIILSNIVIYFIDIYIYIYIVNLYTGSVNKVYFQ